MARSHVAKADFKMTLKTAYLSVAITVAISGASLAAGSDDTSPPTPSETTTQCEEGQVFDATSKTCLDAKAELFDDDTLYAAARELAYDGQYENAQTVLAAAADQSDPRILTYYGFTNRKMGNTKEAERYYNAALAIDPDYILARSYMGQGMIAEGDVAGAKAQLREIEKRGGGQTWAYAALSRALTGENTDY